MQFYHEVALFLYYEARLMDGHHYDEWLALWTDPAHYWIPCNSDDADRNRSISLVNESRRGIEDRIARLKSGAHYAQDPKSRLSRVVSNIEIIRAEENSEIVVASTFNLSALRKGRLDILAGRSTHTLHRSDSGFQIGAKKVILINNDEVINNLTYLV